MNTHCPSCEAPITFFRWLRQPTPFRYKCPDCNGKFRIETPGMKSAFIAAMLVAVVIGAIFAFGAPRWGSAFAIPFVILAFAGFLALEVWAQKIIIRSGTFTPLGGGNEPEPTRSS